MRRVRFYNASPLFLPWKVKFPPLEILFSKAGKFLETSHRDTLIERVAETEVGIKHLHI